MKIPAIRNLVDFHPISTLEKAESALLNEKPLPINVEGDDEGEKLTHIIAAIWILKKMNQSNLDFRDALREYSKKVRESISV